MKAAAAMVILLLGLAGAAQGSTLIVTPSGSPYASVQDAVNHAVAGDIILLEPGSYTGPVMIMSPIILKGSGKGVSTLIAESGETALVIQSVGVQIQGITIRGDKTSTGIRIASDHADISNIEVTGFESGIILEGSSGSRITESSIHGNAGFGLTLRLTSAMILTRNTLSANNGGGLYIDGESQSNVIYLNDFENGQNVVVRNSGNSWNSPTILSYSYGGSTRNGIMGNYWSDYQGTDTNIDGIGDLPYVIMSNRGKGSYKNPKAGEGDLYPLMEGWEALFSANPPPVTTPIITETTTIPVTTFVPPSTTTVLEGPGEEVTSRGWPYLLSFAFLLLVGFAGVAWFLASRRVSPKSHDETSLQAASPSQSATDTIIHQNLLPAMESGATRETHFPVELQDRYIEVTYAGRGGIARVYRAKRKGDGRIVAVKIPVSFDEETGRAFMNEMRVWEELRHPNIVEVTAVNILPIPYVEMEYLQRSLDQCRKPMDLPQAMLIVRGIAQGLSYAHRRGVIHRDLKPQNILLDRDLTPKISDWGLSRGSSDDSAENVAGFSLPYASPEQLSPARFGSTGPWTDLYQLGVILYELVFGTLPFRGEGLYETGTAILSAQPIPPSVLPETTPILPVIQRCLEKEPSKRYRTAEEFLDDLKQRYES